MTKEKNNLMNFFQIKFKVLQILFISAFCFAGLCNAQNESNSVINKSKMSDKEKIVRAFELAKQKKSFVLEMVDSSEGLEFSKLKATIFASAGNLKMQWNYKDKDFEDKVFSEIIIIGETVYSRGLLDAEKWKIPKEKWKVSKKDASYDIDFIADYEKRAKLIRNVQFVGKEEIDGLTADLYQYDFDINVTRDKSFVREVKRFPQNKIKIWIDSNGLPMKIEYSKKFELSKSVKSVNMEEKFKFDENVKIIAPNIENGK